MPFIEAQYKKILGEGKYLPENININTDNKIISEILRKNIQNTNNTDNTNNINYFKNINFHKEIKQEQIDYICKEFNISYVRNDESYIIIIDDEIDIYSDTEKGLFYGCVTLIQNIENHHINRLLIYDYPLCAVRGARIYLPGTETIDDFKKFVNMLCYYKMNTLVIEVGGAMEYKRHPEINEGWVELCNDLGEYSGKYQVVKRKFDWFKDSFHYENGEGSYLSQEVVKELVEYCKERHINVIPEVPSLSHSDYILYKHQELKERKEDPYPDTYCPSNPKTYELLFDILDEVIEVFDPDTIHIGHDEYYSMALCEKCRTRKAEDILADDVNKIYQYLKERNIETMMWGDMLVKATKPDGYPIGGSERKMYKNHDPVNGYYMGTIPATYKAIDKVPNDIHILNWTWEYDPNPDKEYLSRGMPVTYGNFKGYEFEDWAVKRNSGINGGIISNWGSLKTEVSQRNGILFNTVYSAYILWNKDYDNSMKISLKKKTFAELYRFKNNSNLHYFTDVNYDVMEDKDRGRVTICHSTSFFKPYRSYWCGSYINIEDYLLGYYVITFNNSEKVRLPIVFGYNIYNYGVHIDENYQVPTDDMDVSSLGRTNITEVSYTTLPVEIDNKTYYECTFEIPYPSKEIKSIEIDINENLKGKWEIYLRKISL